MWEKSLVACFLRSGGLSLRERRHSSQSQLLMPHCFPFFVFVYFQFELFSCNHSVFIPVLVFEHVFNNQLYGQSRLYTTFALCNLQLDELLELKYVDRQKW